MSSARVPAKGTVLIVDDDEQVRRTLARLLTRCGFEIVAEAQDGSEAVACVAAHRPKIVILDWKLPYMNGDKTARLVRAASPDSVIVAFSAYLESAPEWSDLYVSKESFADLPDILEGLVNGRAGSSPNHALR
ncbi:MAG: response regulator [Actinomycetota bacterium]|nr:response regulator [Actinomycetota bacterium]